jgi:hypothetical protein
MLTKFLVKHNISHCFAGIEHDMVEAIPRHIVTQFPIWKTAYKEIHDLPKGNVQELKYSMDDPHTKFVYTKKGTFAFSLDPDTIIEAGKLGSHTFREKNHDLSLLLSRIICEPKWDGSGYDEPSPNQMKMGEVRVTTRLTRNATVTETSDDTKSVTTLCHSVADHAKESYMEMDSKLRDLLALVDISVQTVAWPTNKERNECLYFWQNLYLSME